ncbi:MAG: efflux RND transporter periplasmic adaptor subunit [Planctomycetia bacterium]|nr:MAG: efflux RND transporter periplasmic adaptor subunit [Planctomycetia bacterium]
MARSRASVAMGALALVTAAVLIPVYAHEGHGKPTGATFDPNAPKKISEATALAIGLKTAEVDFGQVEDVVRLTGMVRARPDSVAAIAPKYAGVIRSIAVQPGDRVIKGAVLAEVDSPEIARLMYDLKRLEAETEKLLAEVKRAESQVVSMEIEVPALVKGAELAEAEVKRLTSAGESVSANLLAQRTSEALKLGADAGLRGVALTQARAEVESLRRQAETTRVSAESLRGTLPSTGDAANAEALADPSRPGLVKFTSPIDGVVVSRAGVPGEGVNAGVAILTVGEFAAVQAAGELPEGLIDRVGTSQGAKVRVRRGVNAASDPIAEGTVRFISPVIDATKRTAHLIVDVDNTAGVLRQGQFVDLAVVLSTNESAVVVPTSAVVREGPLQYVFVQEGKGESVVFKKRDVATGVRDDRVVEIKQGVVPGDVIVVSGAFSVSQLKGFVPGAPEPTEPATGKGSDGHGHTH